MTITIILGIIIFILIARQCYIEIGYHNHNKQLKSFKDKYDTLSLKFKEDSISNRINQIMRKETDPTLIIQNIVEIIGQEFNVDRCIIYDYIDDFILRSPFLAEYRNNNSETLIKIFYSLEEGNTASKANRLNQKILELTNNDIMPIAIDNINEQPEFAGLDDVTNEINLKSMMFCNTSINYKINGLIILHDNKERIWTRNELIILRNISRQVGLVISQCQFISTLVKNKNLNEELIHELEDDLHKEKKINELQSDFISMASHEFRTPLAVICSAVEVIERYSNNKLISELETMDNDKIKPFDNQLKKIKINVNKIADLIESTLSLSKLEKGDIFFNKTAYNLKELISQTAHYIQEMHKKAKITVDLRNVKELYYGDQNLLEQVFINLFTNAIKYCDNDPIINVTAKEIDNQIEIRIEDNGKGIEEQDLPKIFDKFFRAKNSYGISGTGIGLYIVKSFIELHEGSIKVESKKDKGSIFIITLPVKSNIFINERINNAS